MDVRLACPPEVEDSEEGCPEGTLGPRGFREEFWKQKPVLLQGAAKEWGEVLGGGFPVDRRPATYIQIVVKRPRTQVCA